jgi:hypothetical protein
MGLAHLRAESALLRLTNAASHKACGSTQGTRLSGAYQSDIIACYIQCAACYNYLRRGRRLGATLRVQWTLLTLYPPPAEKLAPSSCPRTLAEQLSSRICMIDKSFSLRVQIKSWSERIVVVRTTDAQLRCGYSFEGGSAWDLTIGQAAAGAGRTCTRHLSSRPRVNMQSANKRSEL